MFAVSTSTLESSFFLFFILSICSASHGDDLYGLFSTKTPYSFVENDNLNISRPSAECKAFHVNMVHRHGHRYPSSGDLKDFADLSRKINRGQVVESNLNFSLPWYTPFFKAESSHLTNVGELELYQLSKRIKARFPSIIHDNKYSPWKDVFMSTNKERTIHSANALSAGFFEGVGSLAGGKIQPITIVVSPRDPNDKLLHFYDACPNFVSNIADNQQVVAEFMEFQKGQEVQLVKEKIKKKLNLTLLDDDLSYDNLDSIFISCAYELSMLNGSMNSGICALLDEEDRKVLDYAHDLEDFYQVSNPRNPITYAIACHLLDDIMKTLRDAAAVSKSKSVVRGVFRSTHSKAVMMMFTLLGLNKQTEPLMHDNYLEMSMNRSFHGTRIAPFSANFYFVLYGCSGDRVKVQFYWNERLQKLPGCLSIKDCDLDDFFLHFKDIQIDCAATFEKLCETRSSSSTSLMLIGCSTLIMFLLLCFSVMVF